MKKPKIICLCGSTRFTDVMLILQWGLTKQGFIVLSWCALPESYFKGSDKHHIGDQEGVKEVVDEVHFRKIDLADEVMILNVDGYIGESTQNELNYARKEGKIIRFLEPEITEAQIFMKNYLETKEGRMSKLNQGELLKELNQMEIDEEEIRKGVLEVPGVNIEKMNQIHEKRKQALQQIKEMIQKPGVTKEEFQVEAKKLFERSKQFKVLYDAEVYLVALLGKISGRGKPEVTEEWIEEKAKKICKVIEEHEVYMGLPFWENFIRKLVGEIK